MASAGPALHAVGSRVWLADEAKGWAQADVTAIGDNGRLTLALGDGSSRECAQEEAPLQNPGTSGVEVRAARPPPAAPPTCPPAAAPASIALRF
jgi:hypothetical protein